PRPPSGRAKGMYATPLKNQFADVGEVVGIYDINKLRSEYVKKSVGLDCEVFTDPDEMIAKAKPDAGIVTTVDRFHHEYIIKCLENGMDAITEKPMTIDAEKCNAILEAEQRTGKKVTVTFNYRYAPYATAIKQALKDGIIGNILCVDFEYLLDTSHGADYFRRWHRRKENSGGLLVHKSTHHFDLINWWIDDEPEEVMAFGTLRFYGPTREERGERCSTCKYDKTCEYYRDMKSNETLKQMYFDCESEDGYFRDRCVFDPEIDIEDSMSVNVKYKKGAVLSYSLIAHSPYEGYMATFSGTNGRMEIAEYHSGLRRNEPCYYFDIYDRQGRKINYTVPKASGGHGGGDERLLNMLFRGGVADPLGHQAGSYAGAVSILTGIAANTSIKEGRNVKINDLVPLDKYRK
ncbi:MAG: Gfo/Idh/MocA family oxidoreductase, partial [Armatimonadota bacterium]